jgi:hypothetical protein
MSLLNFKPSGLVPKREKQSLKIVLGIGALFATVALGSTLAANITLNIDGGVEFGQGVVTTAACDESITVTPISAFANSSGSGAFNLETINLSGIDTCSGKTLTIKGWGNDNSSALFTKTYIVAATSTSIDMSSEDPRILADALYKITIESKDSVEIGPVVYEVGERGPGGGIVFYVSATNFTSTGSTCNTTCKYLEVAPSTWRTGVFAEDINYQWSNNTSDSTGQDSTTSSTEGSQSEEKFNWKIGQGFYNTSVMQAAGAMSAAQTAVLAYAGNVTAGEWFIPSMNELNELCKYARGQTTGNPKNRCNGFGDLKTGTTGNDLGGFVAEQYWSSSEWSSAPAFSNSWYQTLSDGYINHYSKSYTFKVRPIRAF